MRKTSIKRANLNPVYHECLEFDLLPSQIGETNLLVQVMDWDRIGRDDLLGCCVVGKESPTKEGRQQWVQCFAELQMTSDSSPLMSHSVSANPDHFNSNHMELNGCREDRGSCVSGKDAKFLLDVGCSPQMSISKYTDDGVIEEDMHENVTGNGALCSLSLKIAQSAPTSAKNSAISGINGHSATDGVPRAIGVWHSILGEVPEGFRNIPKAKKK